MDDNRLSSLTGALFVIGAIVSWGSYFPYAKLILTKLSPEVFLVFRLGIGTAVLLAFSLRLEKPFVVKRRDWISIAVAAVIGIIAHQLIQLIGLIHTTATNTAWILTLIPPVTGILGWLFLKERVGGRQLLGLALAISGVALFVTRGHPLELSFRGNYGDFLALVSVFTWATYTVMTKSRLTDYHPLPLSAIHMGLGWVFFLLLGSADLVTEAATLELTDWLIVILIGIFPSGLAYYWWNAGLKRLSAIGTSMFLFIQAAITTFVGFLLLGEGITWPMVPFAVLIVGGVFLAQSVRRPPAGEAPGH